MLVVKKVLGHPQGTPRTRNHAALHEVQTSVRSDVDRSDVGWRSGKECRLAGRATQEPRGRGPVVAKFYCPLSKFAAVFQNSNGALRRQVHEFMEDFLVQKSLAISLGEWPSNVRDRGRFGRNMLRLSSSGFDPYATLVGFAQSRNGAHLGLNLRQS